MSWHTVESPDPFNSDNDAGNLKIEHPGKTRQTGGVQ